MKLIFSWQKSFGLLSPTCSSNIINSDGISPLACLLVDSAGLPLSDAVAWLHEGAKRVELIKTSQIELINWSCSAWGTELTRERAKIYSLYDESYFELLNTNSFEVVILAWIAFVKLKPELGANQVLEI